MFISRTLPLALLLSTSLTLAACSDKNTGEIKEKSSAVQALKLTKADGPDFKSLLSVKKRKTSEAEAEAALKDLGFWTETDSLKWGSRTGTNGTYTFTDIIQTVEGKKSGEDGKLMIDELVLTGLHEANGNGSFDKLDMEGVQLVSDSNTLKIETAAFSRPSPKMARVTLALLSDLTQLSDLNALDLGHDENGNEGSIFDAFEAAALTGFEMEAIGNSMTLENFYYGQNSKTEHISFAANDLRVTGTTDDNIPLQISLDKMLVEGLEASPAYSFKLDKGSSPFMNMGSGQFDQILFENFDMNYDTLSITSKGLQAETNRKGSLEIVKQVINPITLKIADNAQSPEIKSFKETLSALGYEDITISGQQTSELDRDEDRARVIDNVLEMEDGFILKFSSDVSGIMALQEALKVNGDIKPKDLKSLIINSGSVALTDKSIIDRVFKLVADKQGSSPAVLKMQAKSVLMLGSLSAKTKEDGEVISNLAGAVGTFIEEGGTLNLNLEPETPFSMGSLEGLQNGKTPLSDLGLSAEVTP